MSVPLSYITVILIWTTTPLAIKWSAEGTGFVFAVSSRMIIGAILALLVTLVLRLDIPWHKKAIKAYMFSGYGIAISMMFVYWAAQYVPSGWISLIFGLSPIITGLLVYMVHGENDFSREKLIGLLLGLAGLAIIFSTGFSLNANAVTGIVAVLVSTVIYSFTAIKIKQHNEGIPALTVTAAGLLFAVPLYGLSWYLIDGVVPVEIEARAGLSILYLALFGSVIGFALFFYILKHVSVSRVSLITLVTPVTALFLGKYLNNEPLTLEILAGAMMILSGLASYEFGNLLKWRKRDSL
ncbi:MAG: DMT family transporter [Gammaproteobacteria bacterium]|nr:DMT family transporter [Gammaproteobacteria bacterium]